MQTLLPLDKKYIDLVIKRSNKVIKNIRLTDKEELSILNNWGVVRLMRDVARHYEYSDKHLPSLYSFEFNDDLLDDFPYFLAFSAVCYLDKPKKVRGPRVVRSPIKLEVA